jgi:dihydroorotate dehydrogenase (fumarate)
MKPDLTTSYLGLTLKSPFVIGASPLTENPDTLLSLQDAGASAVVMHSLFEEQLTGDIQANEQWLEASSDSFAEATSFLPGESDFALNPEEYLAQIALLKRELSIPVIASLNGCTPGGWVSHAALIEQAGADALELNVYHLATDTELTSEELEKRLLDIVRSVRENTKLPLSVKLSPFFTSLPNVVKRLQSCGAQGVVLFNRFYQPDFNVEDLEVEPRLYLSTSSELLLRLRWIALLYGNVPLSLALSGGVHRVGDMVKAIMAGADIVQVVSLILRHGAGGFQSLVQDFIAWMEAHEYRSVDHLRGALSAQNSPDPAAFERANYLRILQLWKA